MLITEIRMAQFSKGIELIVRFQEAGLSIANYKRMIRLAKIYSLDIEESY